MARLGVVNTSLFVILTGWIALAADSSPPWSSLVTQQEHSMQQEALNRALVFGLDASRDLQEVVATPESICASINNLTDYPLTCECSRFDTLSTRVDCFYDVPQCNADNSTCYSGTVSQILDPDRNAQAVTTCTQFSDEASKTCIRVFPAVHGQFQELTKCTATWTPTGDEALECSSCSVCGTDPETEMVMISIDCCNLEDDLQQTCAPVSTSGAAIPQFDEISPDEAGTCVSGSSFFSFTRAILTTAAAVALTLFYF